MDEYDRRTFAPHMNEKVWIHKKTSLDQNQKRIGEIERVLRLGILARTSSNISADKGSDMALSMNATSQAAVHIYEKEGSKEESSFDAYTAVNKVRDWIDTRPRPLKDGSLLFNGIEHTQNEAKPSRLMPLTTPRRGPRKPCLDLMKHSVNSDAEILLTTNQRLFKDPGGADSFPIKVWRQPNIVGQQGEIKQVDTFASIWNRGWDRPSGPYVATVALTGKVTAAPYALHF